MIFVDDTSCRRSSRGRSSVVTLDSRCAHTDVAATYAYVQLRPIRGGPVHLRERSSDDYVEATEKVSDRQKRTSQGGVPPYFQ